MKREELTQLAKAAQRDGLTLYWSVQHLMGVLERMPQRIAEQSQRDTRTGDAEAHNLRVEQEALAIVLAAVLQAYPAGSDLTIP